MTRRLKTLAFGGVLLALAGSASTHAWAGNAERTMYVTFSGAVALPGVQLTAGTYIFELAAPNHDLSLVRVLSRDRNKIYFLAFTNMVPRPASLRANQVVTLGEHAAGAAAPVKVWYPAGADQGREFVYNR
jgi:hypothetical protein